MKPLFVISCPIDTYSGYGARARDLVKAIINQDKYDVKIVPQRWGNTPWGFIEDHQEQWGFLKTTTSITKYNNLRSGCRSQCLTSSNLWENITSE